MYLILHALTFIFLSAYAFRLMISKPSFVKLSKNKKILLSGREKFLLFTLITGMFQVGMFSSLRLMVWIAIIASSFFIYHKSPRLNRVIFIYILFLLWISISILWSPSFEYGFREFLKYSYPILILLFAFTFIHSKDFIFLAMKWMLIVAFWVSLLLGGVMTHLIGTWYFYLGGMFWPISTLADYLAVMSAVSFVMWWRTKEKKYLFLIAWFILSAILQSVRTGILSIGVMLIVASYLRYRLLSLPYIVGAIAIGLFSILYIPQIKDKMFFNPNEITTVNDIFVAQEDGNVNTNERSDMWEHLLARFYKNHQLAGSGLGAVQHYMYENYVFGGLHVPHSDYVQMLCDTGEIGLFLYLLFPFLFYIYAKKFLHKRPTTPLRSSAILALLSYSAVLPAMAFDNVVNYSFASHSYPFIFIGIFLAYKNKRKPKKRINNYV